MLAPSATLNKKMTGLKLFEQFFLKAQPDMVR